MDERGRFYRGWMIRIAIIAFFSGTAVGMGLALLVFPACR